MSNIGFCQKIDNSQFVVLAKLTKSAQIAKIRSLLLTKLFYGPGMKVSLFLRFGKILMLKMVSKDSQL